MAISLNIEKDFRQVERMLGNLGKQTAFAASLAINATLSEIKVGEVKELEKSLHKPTPFTRRGFYVKRSRKKILNGEIGLKDIQAEYLRPNITGGKGFISDKFILAPKNIRLNKFGNLPRRKISRLLQKKNTFHAVIKNVDGIWQRINRGRDIKLLVRLNAEAPTYKRRYDFYGAAHKIALTRFPINFTIAISKAIATAR